ncbi:MAG TPA: glycosyltransferase [Chloroflexia bacterium]|jgi:glycosyltransferase involved in cell wall biosynthesis
MKLNVVQMTDVTGRGGAEKVLVDLALRLDRARFNVTVVATRSTGNYQPLLDAAGVRTLLVARASRWESHKMLGLVRFMRREPVHILHTHLFGANSWGRVLGRLAGVPVIVAHEHWSSKARREVWVDRLLYRLTDRILVPSQASKQLVMQMEGIPARYLDVTYNGVDISQFKPGAEAATVRRELGLGPEDVVIGTVGRLTADKGGQDDLIWAANELRLSHPNARLLIIGDGPLRPDLEKYATELGMLDSGAALFTGTRNDIAHLLGAMDVFVLPSHKEALPVAVLEAMAMCLPVVATRVGGLPEVVQDGSTGLLVEPGDRPALRDALARLLSDRELAHRLGASGQARVHAHFTVDKMVEHVEELYERLMLKRET